MARKGSRIRAMKPRKMTPKTKATMAAVYAHWKANPHLILDELTACKGGNRRDLNEYMREMNLPRPDGRVLGQPSSRQVAIREAYEEAAKKKQTVGWAVLLARKSAKSVSPGDFRYYSMKNNLPDLPEKPSDYQTSPHKVQL